LLIWKDGTATQLIVNGKSFLALGGTDQYCVLEHGVHEAVWPRRLPSSSAFQSIVIDLDIPQQ
jgi:hypothetical protein